MVQLLEKTAWSFLKKLHIELTYDPAILLLSLYPREMKTYVYTKTCSRMFRAALFIMIQK